MPPLPLGKLSPDLLARILDQAPITDPRVILGPGIGLDCAVVAVGDRCLVFKSDPITFATDEIGWYAVQVNANDIATTGATPRWFLVTLLLPEGKTTADIVEETLQQVHNACSTLEISVIGGHTEITHGIERPIIAGTMIGEVFRDRLITPKGVSPGERILLTKSVPIEGTAILAREFTDQIKGICTGDEIQAACDYLYNPGLSVVRDARIALQAGVVTAMHDPTEGGLSGALWELAVACGHTLVIDLKAIPVSSLSKKICEALKIDPLGTIASGALLLTTPPTDAPKICRTLRSEGIPCAEIGYVEVGTPKVVQTTSGGFIPLPHPVRDEIARLYDE